MRASRGFLLAAAFVAAMASSGRATPLGLTLLDYPDIISGFIDVSYNAGSYSFVADGFAFELNDDNVAPTVPISSGLFQLSASINNSGVAGGGSLTILGSIPGHGSPLLTGNLTAFGWLNNPHPNPDLFEFLFTVTGGSLAVPAYYGGVGSIFGVILTSPGSTFNGSWGASFSAPSSQSYSDTAPIPEPSTLALVVFLVTGLAARRHGRRGIERTPR